MFKVGDMVRVTCLTSLGGVSDLGFVTDICTHFHHRHDSRCIEITYLKPRVSQYHGGRLMKTHLIPSPYPDVSLVSSPEDRINES